MVKYFEVHNCRECPYYDDDKHWGREVCLNYYHDSGDVKDVKDVNPNEKEIPDWCPLDGPNDL